MEWLLQRFLYDHEKLKMYSPESKQIIQKYAKMAEIQAQIKYGDVFTIEDFIEEVETGGFMSYDGTGYYWDTEKNEEAEKVSFDINKLKQDAQKYEYVIWYNR